MERNLPGLLDHTVLRPEATKADVLRLCAEAKEHGFVVIFVPPCYVDEAVAAVVAARRCRSAFRSDFRSAGIRPMRRSRRRSRRWRMARECWTWSSTSAA